MTRHLTAYEHFDRKIDNFYIGIPRAVHKTNASKPPTLAGF